MDEILRKIIAEEVKKILREEDFNYASQDEQMREAMISSALGFMQDVQGSANKLVGQTNMAVTDPGVDEHLGLAIEHINKAIEIYFDKIDPEIKDDVVGRLGELKIDR